MRGIISEIRVAVSFELAAWTLVELRLRILDTWQMIHLLSQQVFGHTPWHPGFFLNYSLPQSHPY